MAERGGVGNMREKVCEIWLREEVCEIWLRDEVCEIWERRCVKYG